MMEKTVIYKAPAKINLYLDVTGKRGDCFHNLETVMQSISLCDRVTVTADLDDRCGNITVSCTDPMIPADEDNICAKAVKSFFEYCGEDIPRTHIHIEKNIPSGAGMGGGSADAAAAIAALNNISGAFLDSEELCNIAAEVGADVPFCVVGRTQYCTGKGDLMRPLTLLPDCHIVVAKGEMSVSTAEAYKAIDEISPLNGKNIAGAFCKEDIVDIAQRCENIFEQTVANEEIREIKEIMKDTGALCAVMTGSGAAVFGIYEKAMSAAGCADRLKAMGYFAVDAIPTDHGVKKE